VIEYSLSNPLIIQGRKVGVRYADLTRTIIPPPEPECISVTADVVVPGLHLFPEFVTEEEERELIEFSDQKDSHGKLFWKTNLHRRVQHFGYEFNYSTLLLDRTANLRSVPSPVMTLLQDKLAREGMFEEEARQVNQLTINEYYPGQGIATHVGL
jgi:alkylated DNA repair dioxygenase AlkB